MAIKNYKCQICGHQYRTKDKSPEHCGKLSDRIMVAPTVTILEKQDPYTNKSRLKDQEKILKERARNHSRDVETTDLIEKNPLDEAVKNGWIKEDGTVRKKIDDR